MATSAPFSSLICLIFLSIISSSFILHSMALNYVIGGRDGWIVNPKEDYNHLSHRLRFQVNDTILFRYSNTTDSVLAVSKTDYDNCNVENAIIKLDNSGNSFFKFGHSGPFYFITGNKTNCEKGQKLFVVVLGTSHHHHHPVPSPPSPSIAPAVSPSPLLAPTIAPVPSVIGGAPEAGEGPFGDNAPGPAPTVSAATPAFSGVNSRVTVGFVFIMIGLVMSF